MAFDYNQAYLDAMELIAEFGGNVTFTKGAVTGQIDDLYNPIPDVAAVTVDGLMSPLLNYGAETLKALNTVEGSNLLKGDKFAFFDAQQAIEIGMTATVNGSVWRVQSMSDITSIDNIAVLNKLQMRKG